MPRGIHMREEAHRLRARIAATTHGKTHTYEYKVWAAIVQRCYNPNATSYNRYGARGITMCARWRHSFENFLADMGPCPRPGRRYTQIERVDNSRGYDPDNCIWATPAQQAQNRRRNPLYKLTAEDVKAIHAAHADGNSGRQIAQRFGIHQCHVSRILSGKRHKKGG